MAINDLKKVMCKKCGKYYLILHSHLKTQHKLSASEYKKKYPNAKLVSDIHRKSLSDKAKNLFESNPGMRLKVANRTFKFIDKENLKPLLQRDYKDAKTCLKNKLWKSCIILYGSIIEAILIEKHPKAKDFYDAIKIAFEKKDLSEKEYFKVSLIRNLRNFVHLHAELSEEEGEINEHSANTFSSICESIIKRFNKQSYS